MKTVLKGVKFSLEIESVEVDDTNNQNNSTIELELSLLKDKLTTLIRQCEEIKDTISEKL